MDLIFWVPWAIGAIIFVLWIKKPISEFKQMFKDRHAQQNDNSKEVTKPYNEKK